LIKFANVLDQRGLRKEADTVDFLVKKAMNGEWESKEADEDLDSIGPDLMDNEGSDEARPAESSADKASENISLEWVTKEDWKNAQREMRSEEVYSGNMEDKDMQAMQVALDKEPGEDSFFVIDPFNISDFRQYVQGQQHHEDGSLIAVPLNTYLHTEAGPEGPHGIVNGKLIRINYFKVNDWSDHRKSRFGKVEEIIAVTK